MSKSKVPLYVLPPFFSRFDDPVNYAFKPEPNKKSINNELEYFNRLCTNNDTNELDISISNTNNDDQNNETDNSDLICSVRQERSSQALLITFSTLQIPNSIVNFLISSIKILKIN